MIVATDATFEATVSLCPTGPSPLVAGSTSSEGAVAVTSVTFGTAPNGVPG